MDRLYGFGSVYGKSVRDSRRAFTAVAILMAAMMLVVATGIATAYPTQAARDELVRLAASLGSVAQGIAGKAVNVGTIGGYIQWKYGPIFLWIAAIWSILALSSTLASDARRASLEFVAVSPVTRRRIALEKVAAHVTVLALAAAVLAFAAWVAGAAFGNLPGDAIPLQAAIGYGLWVLVMALAFGGLAFALSVAVGRSAAAGIAGFVMFVGWILSGYAAAIPALAGLADLTPWAWTANHLPLAGQSDAASLVPVALVAALLLLIGVEAFVRRDVGASTAIRTPGLPAMTLGLGGPIGRSFGERLPLALAWGIGLGAIGCLMASISRSLADQLRGSPDLLDTFRRIFPGVDLTTAGGFLQLLIELLFIVAGLAAATLVAGWASDETTGRLEMLLATPLSRQRWAAGSGLGVFVAIAVLTVIAALAIGLGAVSAGSDAITPMTGTIPLGLYAAALAGIGFAIGGVARASSAAGTVVVVAVATYLIDLLGPALNLPDWVHQLALTAHLGQPMVGTWDSVGVVVCLALAAGGLAIGAWGMRRRDVNP